MHVYNTLHEMLTPSTPFVKDQGQPTVRLCQSE